MRNLSPPRADAVRLSEAVRPAAGDHTVRFYEDPRSLAREVAAFVREGVDENEAVILIAKDENVAAFEEELLRLGLDVDALKQREQLVILSAADTLSKFMMTGVPDEQRFRAVMQPLVAHARSSHPDVRAYGEMVDVLWQQGNREAALLLEQLWTRFVAENDFPLLCAYSLRGFASESDRDDFEQVCLNHAHVHPTERLATAHNEDGQNRIIAQLQQRALALETEIERRKVLEDERTQLLEQTQGALSLREEFLALASHELKTPLTSVQLNVDVLLRQQAMGSEEGRKRLERARNGLQRLAGLIESLLDASRLNGGQLSLNPSRFNLMALLRQLAAPFEEHARRQGTELELLGEGVEGVWDRDRLGQVIVNLLSNALKYGRDQKITASVERVGDQAVLTVTDRGVGIATADLKRIFERFERASPVTHHGGVGLGLWMAREIVTAHRGTIDVTSEPGHGSTFRVLLPLG